MKEPSPAVAETPDAAGESRRRAVRRAWLSALAATALWSSNVLAVKLALREIPGLPAAMMRITLAALALAAAHRWRGKSFALRRGELPRFVALGFFGIALSFTFFTTALDYTSVAHAVFIGALAPTVVLLLAVGAGQERFTRARIIGLAVALAGVVLLALDKTVLAGGAGVVASNWRGDLLAVGGVCCFAFYTVRSKTLTAHYDSGTLNMYAFVFAALFCLPVLLWTLLAAAPWTGVGIAWRNVGWVAWTSLLLSGTAGAALPYVVFYSALQVLSASQVAALHYVQPVLATLLGVAFLGERLGTQFTIAAALILAGVLLAERR